MSLNSSFEGGVRATCCLFNHFCLFFESSELHASNQTGFSVSLWPGCFGGLRLCQEDNMEIVMRPHLLDPNAPLPRSLSDWGSDHLVLDGIAASPAAPQMESSSSGLLWLSVGAEWRSVRLFHPQAHRIGAAPCCPLLVFILLFLGVFFFFLQFTDDAVLYSNMLLFFFPGSSPGETFKTEGAAVPVLCRYKRWNIKGRLI